MDHNTVAERVQILMEKRQLNMARLAPLAGMNRQTLSRRLAGESAFKVDELARIAEQLQVSVNDLYGDEAA